MRCLVALTLCALAGLACEGETEELLDPPAPGYACAGIVGGGAHLDPEVFACVRHVDCVTVDQTDCRPCSHAGPHEALHRAHEAAVSAWARSEDACEEGERYVPYVYGCYRRHVPRCVAGACRLCAHPSMTMPIWFTASTFESCSAYCELRNLRCDEDYEGFAQGPGGSLAAYGAVDELYACEAPIPASIEDGAGEIQSLTRRACACRHPAR